MITKMEFNELVENTTRYLQAYQDKINAMENKLADYERGLLTWRIGVSLVRSPRQRPLNVPDR